MIVHYPVCSLGRGKHYCQRFPCPFPKILSRLEKYCRIVKGTAVMAVLFKNLSLTCRAFKVCNYVNFYSIRTRKFWVSFILLNTYLLIIKQKGRNVGKSRRGFLNKYWSWSTPFWYTNCTENNPFCCLSNNFVKFIKRLRCLVTQFEYSYPFCNNLHCCFFFQKCF